MRWGSWALRIVPVAGHLTRNPFVSPVLFPRRSNDRHTRKKPAKDRQERLIVNSVLVAALECDYDRLADLRDMKDECDAGTSLTEDDADELATLESDAGDCKDQDEARERIQEDPLSIEFRTGWMTGREVVEREDWAEAKILLATGGPAVHRIERWSTASRLPASAGLGNALD